MNLRLQQLTNLLFPRYCHFCSTSLDQGHLCQPCRLSLPRITPPYCSHCGESYDGAITRDFQCPNCLDLHYAFDFSCSSLLANKDSRSLVHSLKYQRKIYLAKELAKMATEAFLHDSRYRSLESESILVPVPLHRQRHQWRHFNQAAEITHFLSKELHLPSLDLLKRTRHTVNQAKLTRKERLKNLKGIFQLKTQAFSRSISHQLKEKPHIILIDDVFTTGATAHECAKALKQHPEVEKVVVLTAVRG